MARLVCAQHGRDVNGVQVHCGNTRHEPTTTRGETRAGIAGPLLRRTPATDSEPRQKPRRAAQNLRVPRLPIEQPGQARVDGKGVHPLQTADQGNHQPQPRAQGLDRHRRAEPLHPRLAQLLKTQLHLQRGAGLVSMGQAAGEVVLLEAMEAAAHAPPPPASVGSGSQRGAPCDAEPQRLLADEPE